MGHVNSDTPPLVSIVIPCYNAARYVGESIESALAQTYAHKQVIVIDDGSTDRSVDVLKSFGSHITWETRPHRGACAARNRGLELARGRFVQFLDADDLLHTEKLDRQIPHGIDRWPQITFCRWRSEVLSSDVDHLRCANTTHTDSVILALTRIISTPAPLYPVHLLKQIKGWRESLACAQDYDLNLRLACAGALFWEFTETLITVRRIPGSVSSDMVGVLDEWEDIYWRAYHWLVRDGQMTDERAAAFAAGFATHARVYLRYGKREQAASRFRDALKMHPSGGLEQAYRPAARSLRRLLGPIATETLVQLKRRIRDSLSRSAQ